MIYETNSKLKTNTQKLKKFCKRVQQKNTEIQTK